MNNWLYLILFAAPFTGGITAIRSGYKNERLLKLFTAFAGGYIFCISITDLLPEALGSYNGYSALLILAGFFFQIFIGQFSEGAEHGHLHIHKHNHSLAIPLGLFISMCLHAFTEGIPLGMLGSINNIMGVGIALHELPAAFAMMSIIKTEHISKRNVYLLLLFYALMAPAGTFTGNMLSNSIPENFFKDVLAFVAGVFLYISTTIIFENNENHHRLNKQKLFAVLLGVGLGVLANFLH